MVALVLGLVVSGAALALFMTNKQVYTASENLDRLQETSRTAFELMARDLREADGNPCKNEITLTNELSDPNYAWWSDWGDGMRGYTGDEEFAITGATSLFGSNAGNRVKGTPAVELWTAEPTSADTTLTADMATTADELKVSDTTGIAANDILVICDYEHGTIFKATGVDATTIKHQTGGTPGNKDGNLPPDVYLTPTAVVSKLHAARWYVGYNGRTDKDGNKLTSLYRAELSSGTDGDPQPDEIAEGVTGMTLLYHVKGGSTYDEVPAGWGSVDAVQIKLDLAGRDKAGTDKQTIKRNYEHVVAIRSRAP
jgi:type IV pilus assembly protein PilW